MLECERYKMFYGRATVTPINSNPPFKLEGVWLYKPDIGYWFVNKCKEYPLGTSFSPGMLSDFEDLTVNYLTDN